MPWMLIFVHAFYSGYIKYNIPREQSCRFMWHMLLTLYLQLLLYAVIARRSVVPEKVSLESARSIFIRPSYY